MAAQVDPEREQLRRELQRAYLDFLDDSLERRVYSEKVQMMLREGQTRLIVDMHDLWTHQPERAAGLLNNFVEEIICFEAALREFVTTIDSEWAKNNSVEELFIGFEGGLGERHVNPRTVKSKLLGSQICCEGIVTKCSLIRPKVVRSVHYCPATDKTTERRYTDLTSYESQPRAAVYPREDENKNPLETEFGLSSYKDHQTFTIQELPESAPAGQIPRSLDVIADYDLADRCKPGDRVRIFGLYRCLPGKKSGYTNGTFRTIVIANNIQIMSKDPDSAELDAEDLRRIKNFCRAYKGNAFNILARSLAPSIHGHDEVKRAVLCQLLGGTEKILENGTRLRGDINIMLIGDPSVAKSQILRYVLHTAPRALATTGRGSSGVGLTAAVTADPETGERRLEAGAMVLADRGIVCIDEFDKMSDIDRTAIHEVMEQGRVTIAKAGIHAKLNARCSVLAAANPVYGRYDVYKSPMENIGMQDSLLSRFDCLFVLLDEHDSARDTAIAEHVIKLHRYRAPGEAEGQVLDLDSGVDIYGAARPDQQEEALLATALGRAHMTDADMIWEKRRGWTAGNLSKRQERIVCAEFLQKYLSLAKSFRPVLGVEAAEYISKKYAELRRDDTQRNDRERTMPVTARQLETMIRLSTAIAKARLSDKISIEDAQEAYSLLHFACFKEKTRERKAQEERRRGRAKALGDDEESEEEVSDKENEPPEDASTISTRTKRQRTSVEAEAPASPEAKRTRSTPAISVDRLEQFKRQVRIVYDELMHADSGMGAPKEQMEERINAALGANALSEEEFIAGWEALQADNAFMLDDEGNVIAI